MSGYITQVNYKKAEQVKKPRGKTTRQKKILPHKIYSTGAGAI